MFIFALLLVGSAWAETGIETLIPRGVDWGLVVREMAAGGAVSRGGKSEQAMVVGSLMKLLVSGLALERELEFTTRLSRDKAELSSLSAGTRLMPLRYKIGNLYITGSGNVLLSVDDLNQAVQGLNLQQIDGDIVVDDSAFNNQDFRRQRRGAAYGVPSALGLDLHTVAVIVSPGKPGEAPEVTVSPVNDAVKMAVSARTVGAGVSSLRIDRLDDLSYKVSGNISRDSGPVKERFALDDPALFAGQCLQTILRQQSILVVGKVRHGKTPDDAEPLAAIPGPELAAFLQDMNVHSLNVAADTLLLKLGAEEYGAPGTREKGVRAVTEFLRGLGLPIAEVSIVDGSGLNSGNRMSAEEMTLYLSRLADRPWFTRFKNTLPRPGQDGTVRNIAGIRPGFRVKSGQLEDMYGLAGYGVDKQGRDVAFTFMMNGPGVGLRPDLDRIGAGVLETVASGLMQ